MFQQFSDLREVTRMLHPIYVDQVKRMLKLGGLLLAVLEINAYFHHLESPPMPSPVGAHLLSLFFKTWEDPSRHIKQQKKQFTKMIGMRAYDAWSQRIIELCRDNHILFAYTIPLFAENQINSMSNYPSPAQDVFLNLLSPIIDSDAEILTDSTQDQYSHAEPNSLISVFLYAGQVPFTITCHGKSTILHWQSHLEAATVLLLPQVVYEAEKKLPDYAKKLMRSALNEEVHSWRMHRPTVGDIREWKWLPRLR
ncbi:MAG: hypothetical protein AB1345_01945 [Chloroflexota bacterium]